MKYVRFWGPPVLWMITIFLLSERQRVSVSETYTLNFLFFKTLHLIEYGSLFVMLYRALRNTTHTTERNAVISAAMLAVFYGVLDEFHQTFVPTREGKLRDVIIDGLGVGIAWIFLFKLVPKMPKRLVRLAHDWQLL